MARANSLRNSTTTVVNAVGVAVFTSYLTQHASSHLGEATSICAVAAVFVGRDPALQVATAEFKAQPISMEEKSHAN